jgi:hypothetical protein
MMRQCIIKFILEKYFKFFKFTTGSYTQCIYGSIAINIKHINVLEVIPCSYIQL